MKKLSLVFSLLLLSACSLTETEVVESLDEPEIIEEKDYDTTLLDTAEDGEITTVEEVTATVDSVEDAQDKLLEEYVEKVDNYEEEMEKAAETIFDLQETVDKLRNNAANQPSALKDFIIEYLSNVEQKEYAFDSCGLVANYQNTPWFGNFQKALAEANIYFSPRQRSLTATDFFGACHSLDANIAIFLGAENEFHAVKYNFASGGLRETVLADGTCSDCPTQFGKREGPYIELLGDGGTSYRFYFDKNVIVNSQDLL